MIIVVSGIPRSGTSLMMQMLAAGGMPVESDGRRSPDLNNPRGYFELESVKSLARNPDALDPAEGKVVKIVSALLTSLPHRFEYRVIFMCRPLDEVVASQNHMLERLGKDVPSTPTPAVISAFEEHLKKIQLWLSQQPNVATLYVNYRSVLQNPEEETGRICGFLRRELDIPAMIRQIEHSLYRERTSTVALAEPTPGSDQGRK